MKPVYLDYQATTPLDPRVAGAMEHYWTSEFGNPHSEGHQFGWNARQAVEFARSQVADFIGADDEEITFVSGATESCNLAIRGLASCGHSYGRDQIVTLATEHPAVLETVRSMGSQGFKVDVLPVQSDGLVEPKDLRATVNSRTLLVSAMLVNNEIGVIQPINELSIICREVGAFLHTDATQAAGRIKIDVDELGVDLLSLSGHKIYGPNGIGALYVRNRPKLSLQPLMTGGSQERGLRPGTVPVPLVVGLGEACTIAANQLERDSECLRMLGSKLLAALQDGFPDLQIFGNTENRVPGNLSIGVPGVLAENLVEAVSKDLAISTGAACATGSPEPSHVLTALGIEPEAASTAVRISLGRFTTDEEINMASKSLLKALTAITGRT